MLLVVGTEKLFRTLVQLQMPAVTDYLSQRVHDMWFEPQTAISRNRCLDIVGRSPQGHLPVIPDRVCRPGVFIFRLAHAAGVDHQSPTESRLHRHMRVADK